MDIEHRGILARAVCVAQWVLPLYSLIISLDL